MGEVSLGSSCFATTSTFTTITVQRSPNVKLSFCRVLHSPINLPLKTSQFNHSLWHLPVDANIICNRIKIWNKCANIYAGNWTNEIITVTQSKILGDGVLEKQSTLGKQNELILHLVIYMFSSNRYKQK